MPASDDNITFHNSPSPEADAGRVACGYWTKHQAAAYLGVAVHTVDYLVRIGRLPYHLIARKRRFSRADLDDYAASCRVVAGKSKDMGSVG